MASNARWRNVWGTLATTVIVSAAVQGVGTAAKASPHLFLSPEVSSTASDESVEIEVFIENVTGLRLYEVVLEVKVTGGTRGSLDLTDLIIDAIMPTE